MLGLYIGIIFIAIISGIIFSIKKSETSIEKKEEVSLVCELKNKQYIFKIKHNDKNNVTDLSGDFKTFNELNLEQYTYKEEVINKDKVEEHFKNNNVN